MNWQWLIHDAAVFFTAVLVIVAVLQIGLFFWQLRLIRTSLDDAKIAADAAASAATAAAPRGACGDAVLLLSKYLEKNGHTGFAYVLGMRDGGSHAWLGRGALIVDITADQFEDQSQSVIVNTQSRWHSSFRLHPEDQQHLADFERYDRVTAATLANAYAAVVGHKMLTSSR